MIFKDLVKYWDEERPFYVLEYAGMDESTEPHDSIPKIARANLVKIRAMQPEGPYYLGGMCFGGLVAYEMAQQLMAANQEIAFLGFLDFSFPPMQKSTPGTVFRLFLFVINEKFLNGRLPVGARGGGD